MDAEDTYHYYKNLLECIHPFYLTCQFIALQISHDLSDLCNIKMHPLPPNN